MIAAARSDIPVRSQADARAGKCKRFREAGDDGVPLLLFKDLGVENFSFFPSLSTSLSDDDDPEGKTGSFVPFLLRCSS